MKQTLQLKLSQHLTLTPQLQQSIRLLQLSTLELNQELEKFLADNPLLEREEMPVDTPFQAPSLNSSAPSASDSPAAEPPASESSASDTPGNDQDWFTDAPSHTSSGSREDSEDGDYPQQAAEAPSLREHMLEQLLLLNLSRRDRSLVALLIEDLDDDGYLTQSLEEIAEMVPQDMEVDPDELQIALHHLQQLEPAGIGARTPSECLGLQLRIMPPETPGLDLAQAIVKDHLAALAGRDFARLKRSLGCDDDALREAQLLIQSLNPHPGASFSTQTTRYIVPDVVVKKIKNVWVARLNRDAMPKLRIHRMYADILQNNRSAASGQLSHQLQEARWLIKNVQQRFDTILRVSQCIIDRQRHFFEHGEVAMRPLVLREIADTLGLHESTVSRVTTQKFMFTPRGIFELKYFFGSHVATEAGGSCSATAIRALIKQLVAAEDQKKPLSDSKISQILGQQGIVVARRTIAKYRESLHIPPVNLRKAL